MNIYLHSARNRWAISCAVFCSAATSLILIAAVVYFIAVRSDAVGADTAAYRDFYYHLGYYIPSSRFEPGFLFLASLVSLVSGEPALFFGVISLLIILLYLLTVRLFCIKLGKHALFTYLPLTLGFLFFSSWFLSSTTNGLRQGLSLCLLYYGLSYYGRSRLISIFILLLSVLFHYSTLAVFPFLVLLALPFAALLFIFIGLAFFAFFGVSEQFVFLMSEFFGLPVYDFIKSYAAGTQGGQLYYGYRVDIFLYTVLAPIILCCLYFLLLAGRANQYLKILSMYLVLAMPYLVFGFASFSNRFAVIAWFFLPVLYSMLVLCSNFAWSYKIIFAWLCLGAGSLSILLRLTEVFKVV